MSQKSVMERLKKLMALSRSSNAHEAAAALARAQQLMHEHQITEDDLVLSNVGEFACRFTWGAKTRPTRYQTRLWSMINGVFGVKSVFVEGTGQIRFYGLSDRAEMAAYTCEVLSRQLRQARADFLRSQNKRIKRTTKISRADNFAEGWILAVRSKAQRLAISPEEEQLLLRYKGKAYEDLHEMKGRAAPSSRRSDQSFVAGHREGRNARLHAPMTGAQRLAIAGEIA
ncbi:DUF2786 domain-containing protein [Komagataeibacter melaceti]|uniref:DUF2786 domain-containing protein n=1 Tax=Komagataeibacter melaceti TaxID=2766577 RepID=A0A371Z0X0_9PROT|nr:DUF2786 domain-containing protein [Komagataeibacter melaceti]RFD20123.1 DUF2786 domain-containing protein [Komagataeibacter melaceti]